MMRSPLGQNPDSSLGRPSYPMPTSREIPYDYVATFTLMGRRGNRVQDVINISTEGSFVATAISYSFVPPPGSSLELFPVIHFKYSITDSGTGRELQNLPIHNIAGLGSADGNRPFRPLARPVLFMPRSTIRIEIEEVSGSTSSEPDPEYAGGQIFIVFQGYKMLGYRPEGT